MALSSIALPGARGGPRRRCILVVEDEMLIRIVASDDLRECGHDVIEACNADEALAILHTAAQIDLIVSDVRMPGSIDGMGLLAVVREMRPDLPVIITSGHLAPHVAMAGGAACFLGKPYLPEEIGRAVEHELGKLA